MHITWPASVSNLKSFTLLYQCSSPSAHPTCLTTQLSIAVIPTAPLSPPPTQIALIFPLCNNYCFLSALTFPSSFLGLFWSPRILFISQNNGTNSPILLLSLMPSYLGLHSTVLLTLTTANNVAFFAPCFALWISRHAVLTDHDTRWNVEETMKASWISRDLCWLFSSFHILPWLIWNKHSWVLHNT